MVTATRKILVPNRLTRRPATHSAAQTLVQARAKLPQPHRSASSGFIGEVRCSFSGSQTRSHQAQPSAMPIKAGASASFVCSVKSSASGSVASPRCRTRTITASHAIAKPAATAVFSCARRIHWAASKRSPACEIASRYAAVAARLSVSPAANPQLPDRSRIA